MGFWPRTRYTELFSSKTSFRWCDVCLNEWAYSVSLWFWLWFAIVFGGFKKTWDSKS